MLDAMADLDSCFSGPSTTCVGNACYPVGCDLHSADPTACAAAGCVFNAGVALCESVYRSPVTVNDGATIVPATPTCPFMVTREWSTEDRCGNAHKETQTVYVCETPPCDRAVLDGMAANGTVVNYGAPAPPNS